MVPQRAVLAVLVGAAAASIFVALRSRDVLRDVQRRGVTLHTGPLGDIALQAPKGSGGDAFSLHPNTSALVDRTPVDAIAVGAVAIVAVALLVR
jgi:hypothetical protein